ncbi:MAG: hypothetical protein LAN64_10445 [Acidobacteriia bacterium]|nr:hypothetical protein [Terriglobia bacterium]
MSVYVFTGPSLPPEQAREYLDAVFLPPVSQGDVYRAARKQPCAIGIIDGYFERVPSVWHKEILWAMKNGIHVFGSASMGALRAVELEAFGMEGVGAVYEAFRSGELEDDDEVAVRHGPPDTGYRLASEAMVNIRITLKKAQATGAISAASLEALLRIAKALFYPERCYPEVLRQAHLHGLPAAELCALEQWLPTGQVDQKREDARAMLAIMQQRIAAGLTPKRVSYPVENTHIWHVASSMPGALESAKGGSTVLPTTLREEMQIEASYRRVAQGALVRFLAATEASRQNILLSAEQLQETGDRWRDKRDLADLKRFQRWLTEHDLTIETFSRMLKEEALLQLTKSWGVPDVDSRIVDELLMTGEYDRLAARAGDKERALESVGLQNPSLSEVGVPWDDLCRWYFEERLGQPVPGDVTRYARECGFEDEMSLRRAVLREYCYLTNQSVEAPSLSQWQRGARPRQDASLTSGAGGAPS